MKCVTLERTGERFCSPPCTSSEQCPGTSTCVRFLVDQGDFCFPSRGTCVEANCNVGGCPPDIPLCDAASGRCYRTENRTPCQACSYSWQCGGYADRCISGRCGKDCSEARGEICPSGYTCEEVPSPTGGTTQQCVPLTGDCSDCRADNPCSPNQVCDIPTGKCVLKAEVQPSCAPCADNNDCGAATQTCYQGGCMPYCDEYTPCSQGYRCQLINDEERGQTVPRCVPDLLLGLNCEVLLFCAPCQSDHDCNGGHCVSIGSGGSAVLRCAPHCDATGALFCPPGSQCEPHTDSGMVCRPEATTCP
jgi:hypothetical protein